MKHSESEAATTRAIRPGRQRMGRTDSGMVTPTELGRRVLELRHRLGYTQERLQHLVNLIRTQRNASMVSARYIRRLETGQMETVDMERLADVADALDTTVSHLVIEQNAGSAAERLTLMLRQFGMTDDEVAEVLAHATQASRRQRRKAPGSPKDNGQAPSSQSR